MSKNKKIDHETLLIMAENATASCEAIELGGVWASICEEADVAIGNLRGDGIDTLGFNQLQPAPVGALIDLSGLVEHIKPGCMVEELSALHNQALLIYPEFSQSAGGLRGTTFVRTALAASAPATLINEAEFVSAGVARFELLISQSLANLGKELPASKTIAELVPQLQARVAAVRLRHETRARGELERSVQKRDEADRVLSEKRREKQAKLDETARAAERLAEKKRRDALHCRAVALADKIDGLGLETIELQKNSHYKAEELTGIMRNDGFSEKKLESIESHINRISGMELGRQLRRWAKRIGVRR